MKIYPSKKRITLYYFIGAIIIAIIFFFALFNFFISWGIGPIVTVSCYVLSALILYFLTIKTTFYIIDSKYLSFYRWGKELRYFYKDIIYINQDKEGNESTLEFFTTYGNTIYLTMDRKHTLYNELLKKCPNLLSKEEIKNKYPKAKI